MEKDLSVNVAEILQKGRFWALSFELLIIMLESIPFWKISATLTERPFSIYYDNSALALHAELWVRLCAIV